MFLTLEDPRAKIQGSRDPLGVQPVWSGFGRRLVCNLTTVTNSVRGFTTLLLGRYFGQLLIEDEQAGEEDALPIFLRMEQLAAYARLVMHNADDIRGVERVRRFLNEGRSVQIQDASDGWILSDQKTYGLWGLFTVSSRTSHLIVDGSVGLTTEARTFVEGEYVPKLKPVWRKLLCILRAGSRLEATKRNPVLKALAAAMPADPSSTERDFYGRFLRDAVMAESQRDYYRQQKLAGLLTRHTDLGADVGRQEVVALAEASDAEDEVLAEDLRRVARLEAILAPAGLVFDFLLTRHGQTPKALAGELHDCWGSQVPNLDTSMDALRPEIASSGGDELAGSLISVDGALHQGEYETAVRTLIDWNTAVMARRSAAPWLRLINGKLDVYYRGSESELPKGDELDSVWRNSYFLNSLKSITRQLRAAS